MATEIRLPDVGEGIADVTINRWRVNVGEAVTAGDVILEVATDKVDTEIQAPASGVLLQVNFRAGELAPVTAVMGQIGQAGESVGEAGAAAAAPAAPAPTSAPAPVAESAGVKATPVAKRVAADKGVDLAGVAGTGLGGQITKQDVLAHSDVVVAPADARAALPGDLADEPVLAVRRVAADYNINLREVAGDPNLRARHFRHYRQCCGGRCIAGSGRRASVRRRRGRAPSGRKPD